MQWSKEKGQTMISTKHYTENKRQSKTKPIKTEGTRCAGKVSSSCSTGKVDETKPTNTEGTRCAGKVSSSCSTGKVDELDLHGT